MFIALLILLLMLMLLGAWPMWEHSRNWGYFPSGGFGVLVFVLFLLLITGRI